MFYLAASVSERRRGGFIRRGFPENAFGFRSGCGASQTKIPRYHRGIFVWDFCIVGFEPEAPIFSAEVEPRQFYFHNHYQLNKKARDLLPQKRDSGSRAFGLGIPFRLPREALI